MLYVIFRFPTIDTKTLCALQMLVFFSPFQCCPCSSHKKKFARALIFPELVLKFAYKWRKLCTNAQSKFAHVLQSTTTSRIYSI